MKIKLFKALILTICLVTFLEACLDNNNDKDVDGFYTEKGGWDSGRIPLLKPYEAIIDNKKTGWGIGLEGIDGDTGFYNIKNINVVDSMILVYSINSILHGIDVKQSWHIIIPAKRIEKGFDNYQDYLSYLNKLGISKAPKLHNIESVARYFDKHDIIDWKAIQ